VWVTALWFCRSARGTRSPNSIRANQGPMSAPVVTWILPAAVPVIRTGIRIAA